MSEARISLTICCGRASRSLNTLSITLSSVDVVSSPQKAAQSLATMPAAGREWGGWGFSGRGRQGCWEAGWGAGAHSFLDGHGACSRNWKPCRQAAELTRPAWEINALRPAS